MSGVPAGISDLHVLSPCFQAKLYARHIWKPLFFSSAMFISMLWSETMRCASIAVGK